MTTSIYIAVIFIAELLWSYLSDMMTVNVITRKKWKAVSYSIASLALSYGVLKVIAQHDWSNIMIAASVIGVACGTYLAAARKPKKKRKVMKKIPIMTA